MLRESNDSSDIDRCKAGMNSLDYCPSKIGEAEPSEQPGTVKELKLARALATLTFEAFGFMFWDILSESFLECLHEFNSFIDEVFDALARFVWNLYDEEDIENIAFTDDIFDECERIWNLGCFKVNVELDSSVLDTYKLEQIREQDVCNILKWCNEHKSASNDEPKDFSNFKSKVLLHQIEEEPFYKREFERYVSRARDVMLEPENLDPKGMVKQRLRMEMIDCKCSCVVDALCMRSWKRLDFQKLEGKLDTLKDSTRSRREFERIVSYMHHMFYDLASTRLQWLHKCKSLVKYPLSGNVFGSCDKEVRKVLKYADVKRRSEGRRFIGTDHLVFYLHQMLVSESAMNSKVLMSTDDEEKHNDTPVYHLYQKACKIATELGDQKVGLEHLCVAITSGDDDNKSFWKESVECVRRAKAKRKNKCKEEGEPHPNLWIGLEDGESEERRFINGSVLDVVKKIQDKNNADLENAISGILTEDKKPTHQMSEREMINSLKKTIEINRTTLFCKIQQNLHLTSVQPLAIGTFLATGACLLMKPKRGHIPN